MRKVLQIKIPFLAIVVLFIMSACGGQVQELKTDNPAAEYRLIIGVIDGRSSEFKETIIQGLVEKYKDTCAIDVMNVSNVEQIVSKEYDVVVLIDACRAGMKLNKKVRDIMDTLDKGNLVVFITAGDPEWTYNYEGIDAVTSASEEAREQEVIEEIAGRINEVRSNT